MGRAKKTVFKWYLGRKNNYSICFSALTTPTKSTKLFRNFISEKGAFRALHSHR